MGSLVQDNLKVVKSEKTDWHSVAKTGILIGKLLFVLFLLSLTIIATFNTASRPYSFIFIGLEISIAIILVFSFIRMNTFKQSAEYNFDQLISKKDPFQLLLTNIAHDINKYEEGSSYYFKGVRSYKYSTMTLAGISTVILGLDLSDYPQLTILDSMTYTKFAKNAALIIGSYITVTTALVTFWNIEKYWLTNKTIVHKLRSLRDDIENEFVKNGPIPNSAFLEEKINEYKRIKGDFYKYWEGALADRGSQNSQGSGTK
ncbi:hypothetical protein LXM25_05710 [Dyadobacter sp. LJ53]|uniref:hypothetical protein n=1 Tax=Dyadobacter chenwenxiniae TaxID=2906456 RepID=UPI001F1BF4B6|nr:hypothetical protein [Dyadobacter chenwenxiniae]MCF0049539.1 hypothetical protein [Dyadobacter chenwenxiniae]